MRSIAAPTIHGDASTPPAPRPRLAASPGFGRARAVEDLAWVLVAAMKDGVPVFYRFAVPGEL